MSNNKKDVVEVTEEKKATVWDSFWKFEKVELTEENIEVNETEEAKKEFRWF